jgi:integrase/recombinase XerC
MPLIAQYIHHLKMVKRFSAHTLEAYKRDLEDIFQGEFTYDTFDASDLESWVTTKRTEENLTPSTLNRKLSALRGYYSWLKSEHDFDNPKIRTFKNIKAPDTQLHAASLSTLENFIQGIKEHAHKDSWRDSRNITIVALLYGTGLRVSELQALTWKDVQSSTILVKDGKGGKERHIPLLPKIENILSSWKNQTPHTQSTSPIFPAKEGNSDALTTRRIQKIFKETCMRNGIHEELTPHTMRHSFATHLLQNGANIREVQELLGHSNLATTQKYLSADLDYLRNLHNQSHPLESADSKAEKMIPAKVHK